LLHHLEWRSLLLLGSRGLQSLKGFRSFLQSFWLRLLHHQTSSSTWVLGWSSLKLIRMDVLFVKEGGLRLLLIGVWEERFLGFRDQS
jgi:hypothetical protein